MNFKEVLEEGLFGSKVDIGDTIEYEEALKLLKDIKKKKKGDKKEIDFVYDELETRIYKSYHRIDTFDPDRTFTAKELNHKNKIKFRTLYKLKTKKKIESAWRDIMIEFGHLTYKGN